MRVWIVSVGEPLPTDGENVRLRRMGNLAAFLVSDKNNSVDWFSVSFDHYKKIQRVSVDTDIRIQSNYVMHLLRVNGYRKNISIARIIHHMVGGKKIYQKMRNMDCKPDVIIASMEPLEMSRAAIKFKQKEKVPTIIDVRDLWPEIYYEVVTPKLHWLLRPYVRLCENTLRKTMSSATSIIGLSSEFLRYGLKYAQREKRATDIVIPIAYPNYNYERYKNKWELLEEKFGIKKGDFIVSFLGNFGNQFDFEPIVEATHKLAYISDIKFVLCGTGIQLESIKKRCPSSVIFPGWIEKEDIMTLTANSALGLAPYVNSMNYRLNTPNKFGEYLSASLPTLISVSGLMEDLLMQNVCVARYTDGHNLANIIENYYRNKDKLIESSINARQLYEKMFNGDTVNTRFNKYLVNIVEEEK